MPPEEIDILEINLWDYHNHEHLAEADRSVYYVYSGDYIRKEKAVEIHNKDLAEAMDKLLYASAGLRQPRIRLWIDEDGKPYVDVFGWVEMTPEEHGRREYLRAGKIKEEEARKLSAHQEHQKSMKDTMEDCGYCNPVK